MQIYEQMTREIEKLRQTILQRWFVDVRAHINEGMQFNLLAKTESKILSVNFNTNLKNALKDIKYMQLMGYTVSPDIREFFDKEQSLWVSCKAAKINLCHIWSVYIVS